MSQDFVERAFDNYAEEAVEGLKERFKEAVMEKEDLSPAEMQELTELIHRTIESSLDLPTSVTNEGTRSGHYAEQGYGIDLSKIFPTSDQTCIAFERMARSGELRAQARLENDAANQQQAQHAPPQELPKLPWGTILGTLVGGTIGAAATYLLMSKK